MSKIQVLNQFGAVYLFLDVGLHPKDDKGLKSLAESQDAKKKALADLQDQAQKIQEQIAALQAQVF